MADPNRGVEANLS